MKILLDAAFVGVLLYVSICDWKTMEIPNKCHGMILLLGALDLLVQPEISIWARLTGAACISVPMLLVTIVIPDGFGGGDIKLLFAGGFFLGWKRMVVGAFLGFVAGGAYGVWLLLSGRKDRKDQFAFGPFLCVGMTAALIVGTTLFDWYAASLTF